MAMHHSNHESAPLDVIIMPRDRVAYLVNQYPKVTHSFIRREIAALEADGVSIDRYTIRRAGEELANPADREEAARTEALLESWPAMLVNLLLALITTPIRFLATLWSAVRIGMRGRRGLFRHCAYLAEACLLRTRLRGTGVRHVHAHFGTNAAMVAMFCFMLGGPSYSFTAHGPEEFEEASALSIHEKIRRAAFVVAISSFGKSQLMLHCGPDEIDKIKIVRCGLDEAYLAAGTSPVPDNHRFVCVGRLCVRKGQMQLVEAVHRLRSAGADAELVLAGDGELRPMLEARIAELGLEKAVRITGWIGDTEIRNEIRAARVFVLPSFAEGLPVVIMEALALGRPVVSTFVAGIPELVTDGVNGWLVPAGDVDALTIALRRSLNTNTTDLTRMGLIGATRVNERHNTRREARKLASFFAEAMGEEHAVATMVGSSFVPPIDAPATALTTRRSASA